MAGWLAQIFALSCCGHVVAVESGDGSLILEGAPRRFDPQQAAGRGCSRSPRAGQRRTANATRASNSTPSDRSLISQMSLFARRVSAESRRSRVLYDDGAGSQQPAVFRQGRLSLWRLRRLLCIRRNASLILTPTKKRQSSPLGKMTTDRLR